MNARIGIASLLLLPVAAAADGFDYSYVEAGFISTELDTGPVDVDGDGFGIKGSYALDERYHVVAGYATESFDFDVDSSVLNIGAGLHIGLNQRVDFVGELSYVSAEVDTPFGDADEDGFGVDATLRAQVGRNIEVEGGLSYVNLNNSDTAVHLDGRYYFTPGFAFGGGFTIDDDDTSWRIGVRAEFGSSR